MITASDFIHPEDAAALRQLESIPGFPALVKKILSLGFEELQYGLNMATAIRLSPTQLPNLYNHLPPICKKLGIQEPEFYLQMNPMPNAFTFGDTRIFITITSGLVEMMGNDELDAVIAHECGHIVCHHVLYHSIAQIIFSGATSLGILGSLAMPIQLALLYWSRKSELSCDRCGSVITSPEVITRVMARLSGGPRSITQEINFEEWARQADKYDEIKNENLWNKSLQLYSIAKEDHPFAAARVREILKWGQSSQYQNLMESLKWEAYSRKCPNCGLLVHDDWAYCKYCGTKL